jgi:inositol-phosphate phosphatase/L-galactose 1-phosphate phosphatase/histidinol-phosphatase
MSAAEACPPELLAVANRLADAAGAVLRRHFRTPFAIDDKADASPVTIADRDAEAAMRAIIAESCPGHGVLGEEHGADRLEAEWLWVLDPIDGTRAFITGKPSFGTLVALLHRGRPVLGIIDQPITNERWVGAAGRETVLNGKPIAVRRCPDLAHAYLYTTAPELFVGADEAPWRRIHDAVKHPRYGADCYAYGLVALGCVDLVVETTLKPYDYCALIPVIEGAGGIVTDWHGAPLGLGSDGRVIAAGDARVHAQAMALLRG